MRPEVSIIEHIDRAVHAALDRSFALDVESVTDLLIETAQASLCGACARCSAGDLVLEQRDGVFSGRRCACERGRQLTALDKAVRAAQFQLRKSVRRS